MPAITERRPAHGRAERVVVLWDLALTELQERSGEFHGASVVATEPGAVGRRDSPVNESLYR